MSDEEKELDSGKKFVKVTMQQIVVGVISLIIMGALGFIGSLVSGTMITAAQNKEDIRVINTILETDLTHKLESIDNAIKEYNTRMGSSDANVRRLEMAIIRLETIIDRMEGD